MPLRMNIQSGRKHKSKLDVWENQWSGSLAAPLIFAIPGQNILKCPSFVTIQPVFLSKSKAPRTFV